MLKQDVKAYVKGCNVYLTSKIYYLILVIVDWLTEIVYYKPIKVTIDTPNLVEAIINMVIYHHIVLELIFID